MRVFAGAHQGSPMGAPYEQEGAVAELLRRLSLEGAATQQRTAAAAEVAEYVQARGPGALKVRAKHQRPCTYAAESSI